LPFLLLLLLLLVRCYPCAAWTFKGLRNPLPLLLLLLLYSLWFQLLLLLRCGRLLRYQPLLLLLLLFLQLTSSHYIKVPLHLILLLQWLIHRPPFPATATTTNRCHFSIIQIPRMPAFPLGPPTTTSTSSRGSRRATTPNSLHNTPTTTTTSSSSNYLPYALTMPLAGTTSTVASNTAAAAEWSCCRCAVGFPTACPCSCR